MIFLQILFLTFVGIAYSSFFEWYLHKYAMHKKFMGMTYAHDAHAKVHHGIFRHDHTYHLQHEEHARTIHMAWWNVLVLVPVASSPFWIGVIFWENWLPLIVVSICLLMYYFAYEYAHWCMHNPKSAKRILKGPFRRAFIWINGHHLLHHKHVGRNFNVVLPLADWCFGTLIRRSRTPFAQPIGEGVPDVQPEKGSDAAGRSSL